MHNCVSGAHFVRSMFFMLVFKLSTRYIRFLVSFLFFPLSGLKGSSFLYIGLVCVCSGMVGSVIAFKSLYCPFFVEGYLLNTKSRQIMNKSVDVRDFFCGFQFSVC